MLTSNLSLLRLAPLFIFLRSHQSHARSLAGVYTFFRAKEASFFRREKLAPENDHASHFYSFHIQPPINLIPFFFFAYIDVANYNISRHMNSLKVTKLP